MFTKKAKGSFCGISTSFLCMIIFIQFIVISYQFWRAIDRDTICQNGNNPYEFELNSKIESQLNDNNIINVPNNMDNNIDYNRRDKSKSKYNIIKNLRPHFKLGKEFNDYGDIKDGVLDGVITHFEIESTKDIKMYKHICDSNSECIGYVAHPIAGIFLLNKDAYPMQYNRDWMFNCRMDSIGGMDNNYTNNLIDYQPEIVLYHDIPIIKRKFISYERNLGRVNNQIGSIEAVIQYSILYQRTLIFPFPHHRNQLLGIFPNGIWNLQILSQICDFILEHEILNHTVPNIDSIIPNDIKFPIDPNGFNFDRLSNDEEKYLKLINNNNNEYINDPNYNLMELLYTRSAVVGDAHHHGFNKEYPPNIGCGVDRLVKDEIEHNILNKCRIFHLNQGRVNPFYLDNFPIFNILQYFIPNEYIQKAVQVNIIYWFGNENNYRIGIHRRVMKEGGHCPRTNTPYVCRYYDRSLSKSQRFNHIKLMINKGLKTIISDDNKLSETLNSITDLYDRTCAFMLDDINDVLQFHKKRELFIEGYQDERITNKDINTKQYEPFWLATDNQEPEKLQLFLDKGGITLNGKTLAKIYNKDHKQYFYWSRADSIAKSHNIYGNIVEIQYYMYLKLFVKHNKVYGTSSDNFFKKRITQFNSLYNKENKNDWNRMFWYKTSGHNYWEKESIIFDMWMITKSQFFIGSWFSTATRTMCHWRGFNNIYNSTNCYIKRKWELISQNNGNNQYITWFDLDKLKSPKIDWNKKVES